MAVRVGGRGVLEGAFALLDALNALGGRAGFAELARAGGLPKTTAHRLLDQLVTLGAVEREPGGYRIGSRVFRLGQSWEPELLELARDWLPVRSARMRVSLVLVVPCERRALVVAGAIPPGEDVPIRPGMTLPPGTAAGRLLAAYALPVDEPDGPADEILANGFAVETVAAPGFGGAAVPVRASHGGTAAALAAILPAGRNPFPLLPGLASTARALGTALSSGPAE